MRSILKSSRGNFFPKNKRGLSAVIAYILLISMAIALSTMVYNWLRFYVEVDEVQQCPEGVSIAINDYDCSYSLQQFNVTLKNRGLRTFNGFTLTVHDRLGATQGIYPLGSIGKEIVTLAPGENETFEYDFPNELADITLLEVQPFVIYEGMEDTPSFCRPIVTQTIKCV